MPQLLWADDYQEQIAALFDFDDFTHWHGRRICSLLLARMLTPLDWDAAVRYLDFPETFINKGYNTTTVKLRAIGRFDELVHRVKRIANHHAEHELIDYKHRRARLADWTGIDRDTWQLLQHRPGQNRWRADTPSRRARASFWLWCQLTSGHERAASMPTNNLAHQKEFIREALPDLRLRAPRPPPTDNGCATSPSRSKPAQSSSSQPPTAPTSHAGPASPPAASTPTSPAPRSPPSTTSPTPNRCCRATVARYRNNDPDFDQRYRQLLDDAEQARRTAGFANANLTRALTAAPPASPGFNYVSRTQLR